MVGLGYDRQIMYRMPASLSGGMRKRAALARSIAIKPEVILYDEPTTGLDPANIERIGSMIQKLQKELHVTSVVVTHDRDLAFAIADRIAFVMDGRIRGVGTPAEFKSPADPVIANFLNPVIDLKNPRFQQLENSHE